MSEMDVAKALLMLSFTRQATRTKTKLKQSLQKQQTAVKYPEGQSREHLGNLASINNRTGLGLGRGVSSYRKWIAHRVTAAGTAGEQDSSSYLLEGLDSVKRQFDGSLCMEGEVKRRSRALQRERAMDYPR